MKEGAVTRAAQAWQTCAVHVRGELRAHGVRGYLRRLDDYAAGYRGTGVAVFLSDFAQYAKDHGMPADRVEEHLTRLVSDVVGQVYGSARTGTD